MIIAHLLTTFITAIYLLERCRRLCLKALPMRAFALFVYQYPPIHQPVLAKGVSTILDRKA